MYHFTIVKLWNWIQHCNINVKTFSKKLFVHKLDIPNDSSHCDFIFNMISVIVLMFIKINSFEINNRRIHMILPSDLCSKRSKAVFVGNRNDLYGIHSDSWTDKFRSLYIDCKNVIHLFQYRCPFQHNNVR